MSAPLQYRFLVRGGTAANLATVNETPLQRELVVARDTGRLKVGDGATPYNDLPYIAETPRYTCVTAAFDGGGADIAVGTACELFVPFGFKPVRATLVADAAGSLVIGSVAGPFATFPTGAASIFGSAPPSLAGASKSQDDVLAGWSVVSAGTVIRFSVTSCTGIKRANLIIEGDRKWQE